MDKFTILRTLGRGTFGVVYKVLRREDRQVYALKQVDASSDALNEVRLLASLEHPNIINFLEAFPFKKNGLTKLAIVMEYASKGDLTKVIRRHTISKLPLKEERIWKYISQISSAVSFLHSHGILHRDLKPANCFLGQNDTIKVGDMNISKVMKHSKFARTKIGTPYYMSPEVGNGIPYNEKCDVWSLGCLAYELAALKVPFTGHSIVDLMRRINMGHRIKLPNKHYSLYLWSLINKMLLSRPSNRITIQEVFTIASSKIKPNNNITVQKINMLQTIKMTPQINQLTSRMPNSQYYKPAKPKLKKISDLPIIASGSIAQVRAAARQQYLYNIYKN